MPRMQLKLLSDVVRDFLNSTDLIETKQLESIVAVLEAELMDRAYAEQGIEYPEAR